MRSWRRVALLLFAVAWGANHFVPLLLVYRARLALSSVELAVLFGVYAVGLVPGLLLGGPLSDRRGRARVVLPASVVELVGSCILACGGEGFAVLLVGRFVVGLGAGATFSAGTAWVADLAVDAPSGTGARRAAVALSSGFGGGPLVASLLAQWLPWPMVLPFVAHAAVLAASIAAVLWQRAPGRASPSEAEPGQLASQGATSGAGDEPPLALPPIDTGRLPAGFAIVAFVAPWVFAFPSISGAVIPTLVRAKIGSLAVVFAGVVTATTLLFGVLVQPVLRKWRPRDASVFGLAAGALGLLCGAAAAREVLPLGALVAAALLGSGYGGCLIAGLRFIETNSTPGARGRLTGLYYAITYLGFASPLALAQIAKRIGDVPSLLVVFSLAVISLVVVVSEGGRPRERRGREVASPE
jgi:predicted MFS family arabinose efflux permease